MLHSKLNCQTVFELKHVSHSIRGIANGYVTKHALAWRAPVQPCVRTACSSVLECGYLGFKGISGRKDMGTPMEIHLSL